jgi:hypothetical protein
MKFLIDVFVVIAAVSLIVGIVSRVMLTPVAFGLEAHSFLGFSAVCLLFAITLGVRALARK